MTESTVKPRDGKIITTMNGRTFLSLCDISYQKKRTEKLSRLDTEKQRLLRNTVNDLAFFLHQHRKILFGEFSTRHRTKYIEGKINCLFAIIESDLEYNAPGLLAQLKASHSDFLSTVVFILATIDRDNISTPNLNKTLSAFASCDEKDLESYIEGLMVARHPKLKDGVTLLKEIAKPTVKEACQIILSFRKRQQIPNSD